MVSVTDRVILRRGTTTAPPLELAPGELSYSPADNRIWLGDFDGNPVNPLDQTTPLSDALPQAPGPPSAGTSDHASRADHVHPHDSAKLDLAGGSMTGALTVLPPTQPSHPATRAYADALALVAGAAPPASTLTPLVAAGTGGPGSATPYAREDHFHPKDFSPLDGGTF